MPYVSGLYRMFKSGTHVVDEYENCRSSSYPGKYPHKSSKEIWEIRRWRLRICSWWNKRGLDWLEHSII